MAGTGSPSDDVLALAIASGKRIGKAAKLAGMSERTAHRRLANADFRVRVQEIRAEILSQTVGKLADLGSHATKTLRALLDANNDSVRLGAAKASIELAAKLHERLEIELRLVALEELAIDNQ